MIISIIAVLAVTSYFVYDYFSAIEINVELVSVGDVVESFNEKGTIRVRDRASTLAQISGEVLFVNYQVGDRVSKGDEVVTIKSSDLEYDISALRKRLEQTKISYRSIIEPEETTLEKASLELEMQRTNYEYAAEELKRAEALFEREIISKSEIDRAKLNYQNAKIMHVLAKSQYEEVVGGGSAYQREHIKAQIEEIELNIERMENAKDNYFVKSPITGTIVMIDVNVGDTILPSSILFQVADLDNRYLYLEVLESRARDIELGQTVILEDGNVVSVEKIHPIAVERMSDLGIRQKRVGVELPLPESFTRIVGSELDVEIIVDKRNNVTNISRDSMFIEENKNYVFIISDSLIKKKEIEVGLATSDKVEVISGLEEGDLIVKAPSADLNDGQRIKY